MSNYEIVIKRYNWVNSILYRFDVYGDHTELSGQGYRSPRDAYEAAQALIRQCIESDDELREVNV